MSAIVPAQGPLRQLDGKSEPDEQVTEDVVSDPHRLSRLLMRMMKDVAVLKRRWWPRRLDFEGIAVDATGTVPFRLPHGFGGAVRYWVVSWTGAAAANLLLGAASDGNTLVLFSTVAGTATVRVEEAG